MDAMSPGDLEKRAALRSMKRVATGFLLGAVATSFSPAGSRTITRGSGRTGVRRGSHGGRARRLVRGHGALPPPARHPHPAHRHRPRTQGPDRPVRLASSSRTPSLPPRWSTLAWPKAQVGKRLGHWLAQPDNAAKAGEGMADASVACSRCSTTARSAGHSATRCRTPCASRPRRPGGGPRGLTWRSRAATTGGCSTRFSRGSAASSMTIGLTSWQARARIAVVGAGVHRRSDLQQDYTAVHSFLDDVTAKPDHEVRTAGERAHRRLRQPAAHRSGTAGQGRAEERDPRPPHPARAPVAVTVGRAEGRRAACRPPHDPASELLPDRRLAHSAGWAATRRRRPAGQGGWVAAARLRGHPLPR